jgi:neprilysin
MVNQYNSYKEPVTGLNLKGTLTLGENIADNGGIIEAYKAYSKWVEDHGEEKKLPGLELTPNQLFWVSGIYN